ncbi:M13 family metallopeptidase [Roseisolibacter sp. H3M3-2]|uniref:M13 family metallopeptidase n=1 Tax=Roseisolibacter sp. H3M3-2 TaxID=3031323 RepID=UPI0023DA666F|nr:M13 family metallopeptidase [Roseisolibacter sp. H3M3-2]MDF1503732.1 M13 family metallopeptidase [Roseisolibacter sp. H3M3-2]
MVPFRPRLALAALALATAPLAAQAPTRPRGIDPANLDTTCAACENFFQYANGGWLKKTQIPPAYARWGSFNELQDKNEAVLREIAQAAAAQPRPDARTAGRPDRQAVRTVPAVDDRNSTRANVQRIGAFYRSCVDSAALEAAGITPLKPLLARIDGIQTHEQLARELGALEAEAGLAPFGAGPGPDAKNSSALIVNASQGGLGLPDRDLYLKDDARSRQVRDAYLAHIARYAELAGADASTAKADAERVLALETRMARAYMGRVEMRNPNAVYNKMSLADFQKMTPHIDWAAYFKAQGAPAFTEVNVRQPAYFRAVDSLLAAEPVESWRAYLRYHAVDGAAGALSSAFVNEAFRFGALFSGAREQQPREKRCTGSTNGALGEAVGQEYVRRTFTEQDKRRALAMVENLRGALRARIDAAAWMSDSTKREALAKLAAFTPKIGYPDRWRDYSALDVRDGPYLLNLKRVQDFNRARNWAKLGKPIDKTEWAMTPPTVNAYYNPSWNEIVFPAGILQAPFYDPQADDAVNYGAMGAVIGHEMSHGFDDQGRQYDSKGNLRDWWTPADAAKYRAEAQKVVEQFDAYTVVDSVTKVNGQLTLGENIADLGGLTIAYHAMQKALEGKPRRTIDGFTPEQRFFLGWAQAWRQLQRDEAARSQVQTDPHAPGIWRVNGPLGNMPEFKAAFGCKEGDKMVRPAAQRAQIW